MTHTIAGFTTATRLLSVSRFWSSNKRFSEGSLLWCLSQGSSVLGMRDGGWGMGAIAQYLGKTDLNSMSSLSKRVAALERQYQKLVKLV
ncbi:MAG: hypothetical protein KME16_27310 [Scytolyngbya sp. HA4215-MV1]|nr:hypothetical protein [Scytolyngbya sp. HA4215-MV1]